MLTRQGFARLLTVAGIILAAAAGGALLPSSNAVQAADLTITATPSTHTAPQITSTISEVPQTTPAETPLEDFSSAPSSTTAAAEPSDYVGQPMQLYTEPEPPALPAIAPAPAQHLAIPAIDVDADILPVDSYPTGETNAWGGEIFSAIDFPVDNFARQWVRRGDPNSLSTEDSDDNAKAFDRTVLYGHASDIGNHLLFQDLSALELGDTAIVTTDQGSFTYTVTTILTREKANLDNAAELYEYPEDGAKELALVACLPDTSSNVVVLATLTDAAPTP